MPSRFLGTSIKPGFIADTAEFDLIAFHYNDGKNTLFIRKSSAVLTLYHNTYGWNTLETVSRHNHTVKLHNGILQFIELGFHGKGQAKQ